MDLREVDARCADFFEEAEGLLEVKALGVSRRAAVRLNPVREERSGDKRRDLRRVEVTEALNDFLGDGDLVRATRLSPPRFDDGADGAVGRAFFVSRSCCILAWYFFAALLVSNALWMRRPVASVQRANHFPYL